MYRNPHMTRLECAIVDCNGGKWPEMGKQTTEEYVRAVIEEIDTIVDPHEQAPATHARTALLDAWHAHWRQIRIDYERVHGLNPLCEADKQPLTT